MQGRTVSPNWGFVENGAINFAMMGSQSHCHENILNRIFCTEIWIFLGYLTNALFILPCLNL